MALPSDFPKYTSYNIYRPGDDSGAFGNVWYGSADDPWLRKYYNASYRPIIDSTDSGYLPGTPIPSVQSGWELKPEYLPQVTAMQRFGKELPTGPMTLQDLISYTGGIDRGVTSGEFSLLQPFVQQQILSDPSTFLKGQLGLSNDPAAFLANTGGSGDLLSIGAEGGVRDLGKVGWKPGVGLVRDPSNFMQVTTSPFENFDAALQTIGPIAGSAIIGNAIGGALGNITSGYNPATSDAVWSANATINPMVSTGMQYASSPLFNMATKNITNSLIGDKQNGFMPQGGNMAIGDMTLGSLAQGIAPFLSAYQGYRNLGSGQDAYNRAIDLIQTPSPDQAKYRGMLSDLMTSPGSFYESPVYQAMAEQGRNALERSQSARGILGSGGAAAELQKLGMQNAAQYYFPQAQMLSGLSGVTGDQAARAMAAQGVLGAEGSRQAGQSAMLNELMKGIGYKSPEEQMAQTIFGGGQGGLGGTTLGTIGNTLKDWFSSSTPSTYDFSSPVFTDNLSWGNLTSGPSAGIDYSNYMTNLSPIDYSGLAGSQQDYLNWFM